MVPLVPRWTTTVVGRGRPATRPGPAANWRLSAASTAPHIDSVPRYPGEAPSMTESPMHRAAPLPAWRAGAPRAVGIVEGGAAAGGAAGGAALGPAVEGGAAAVVDGATVLDGGSVDRAEATSVRSEPPPGRRASAPAVSTARAAATAAGTTQRWR
jgi:hypothetical protein